MSKNALATASSSPIAISYPITKRVLLIRRIAHVNSGGKIRSISALVISGNSNGCGGYGIGRANDVNSAIMKATKLAEKNSIHIPRFDNRTLFSDLDYKFQSTRLIMHTTPPGYGIVANKNIHEICRVLGISDIACKIIGSNNPVNITKAFFEALQSQRTPLDIAKIRGRKLQDVEMTYYGYKSS